MSIYDRLKKLFALPQLSDEDRRVYSEAKTPAELVRGLEELCGRNRLEYEDRFDELEAVSRLIASEREQLRVGGLDAIGQDRLIYDIELLVPKKAVLKSRVDTLKANMHVQLNLIGKIQEMETMRQRGFNEAEVDAILEQVESEIEKYVRDLKAGEASTPPEPSANPEAETAEREARRRRALGEAEPKAEARGTVREPAGRKPETE